MDGHECVFERAWYARSGVVVGSVYLCPICGRRGAMACDHKGHMVLVTSATGVHGLFCSVCGYEREDIDAEITWLKERLGLPTNEGKIGEDYYH